MVDRIGKETLQRVYDERASEFGLERTEEDDGSVTWSLKEQHARLLLLEFLHGERQGLFRVISSPIGLLESLLDHLEAYDAARSQRGPEFSFPTYMRERCARKLDKQEHSKRSRGSIGASAAKASSSINYSKELAEVDTTFNFLAVVDILVLPELTNLASRVTPQRWSESKTKRGGAGMWR